MPPRCPALLRAIGAIPSLALLAAAAPAAGQTVNDFRLPPGPATPTPVPVGPPTDEPPPRPRAAPSSDAPAAGAAATPSGQVSAPGVPRVILPAAVPPTSAPPTAAPERKVIAGRSPQPAPAPASPAAPTPSSPPPAEFAPPTAPAQPAAARTPSAPSTGSEALAWAATLGGIAALGLGVIWLLRRRGRGPFPPPASTAGRDRARPSPAPPPPNPVPAAPAAEATVGPVAAPAPLAIRLEPLRMSLSLVYATLHYRLTLSNPSPEAATGLAVQIDMVAAHASQDEAALLVAGPAQGGPTHAEPCLEAGGTVSWTGDVRLRLDQIAAIRRGPALLFVPLVRIAIMRSGAAQRAAMVVGEPGRGADARLVPFRLDLPPRIVNAVAARPVARPG